MKRSDGYYIKDIPPLQKLIPHIMPKRYDAMNMAGVEIPWTPVMEFMNQINEEQGLKLRYIDVLVATLVRVFAMRPELNRFVMNKKIYQHYDITVAFVIKKQLTDEGEETTVKAHFTGKETLLEVKEVLDKIIADNSRSTAKNDTDKMADFLAKSPHWLISLMVRILHFMDRHNLVPKSLIEVSPFHNSLFITFLKSINGDALFHHCYEFGTTGIFVGFGKDKDQVIVKDGQPVVERILPLGVVTDERFCDGLYIVNSVRLWKKLLADPTVLMEPYLENTIKTKGKKTPH